MPTNEHRRQPDRLCATHIAIGLSPTMNATEEHNEKPLGEASHIQLQLR